MLFTALSVANVAWAQPSSETSDSSSTEQHTLAAQRMSEESLPVDSTYDSAELGPTGRDLVGVVMPPLETLYTNAEQTPGLIAFEKQKEFEVLQLKREKRNFLSFFNLHGNYYYGNGMASSLMFDESGIPIPQTYSRQVQTTYSVGASLSIPLDKLFDLRGSVKRQQKLLEKQEYERLNALEARKVTIATLYARIVSYIPIVKAATEKMVFTNAQYAISENDFINGQIGASEINVEKARQMTAISEYENARSELYGLLLQLEIVSNTAIISKH